MSRYIRGHSAMQSVFVGLILALISHMDVAMAQGNQNSQGNCSPNIQGQSNVINCQPPAVLHNGQCPSNMIYSRVHGDCIPIQNRGGVIPCSPDDARFDQRTGRWVSNC
jgi:hypothetical protein